MGTAMNRRAAIRSLAAGGLGAAAVPLWVDTLSALAREQGPHAHAVVAQAAQAAQAGAWTPKVLNAHQAATVAALCELIIPETDTPGAKAALVDRFVDQVLSEAPAADRRRFLQGLAWMDTRTKLLFGRDFVSASATQQSDFLTRLSADKSPEAPSGVDFFTAIKLMTIAGYYTTEIGLHQELADDGVLAQAGFEGCTHPEHQM